MAATFPFRDAIIKAVSPFGRFSFGSAPPSIRRSIIAALPFSAASDYDLMQAQINTRPAPLGGVIPGVAGRVERALMKALGKKAEQRFATVKEFKDALGASASRATTASTLEGEFGADRGRRTWMPVGARLPLAAAAVLLVAALLIWGAVALFSQSGTPPVSANSPAGEETSSSYSAATTNKKAIVPVKSPTDATQDVGPRSVVLPRAGSPSSPSLILKRQ